MTPAERGEPILNNFGIEIAPAPSLAQDATPTWPSVVATLSGMIAGSGAILAGAVPLTSRLPSIVLGGKDARDVAEAIIILTLLGLPGLLLAGYFLAWNPPIKALAHGAGLSLANLFVGYLTINILGRWISPGVVTVLWFVLGWAWPLVLHATFGRFRLR